MGAYLCIASNDVPPSISKRIMLSVNFGPSVTVATKVIGVPTGSHTRLECTVEAYPQAINYWLKSGEEMILSGDKFEISEERISSYQVRTMLTVVKFSKDDTGTYTCVSSNTMGKAEGTIRLYAPRRVLNIWVNQRAQELWKRSAGLTHSKLLIRGFSQKYTSVILSMNRNNLRMITRALTGHCNLNKHLCRMGLTEATYCRYCAEDDETPLHVLCECEALVQTRSRTTGGHLLSPREVQSLDPKQIVAFLRMARLDEVI
ncbi:immunoglobulin i-set domain-containing protein [Phthorimaea operculella]|nr:immunoglobulin i-set domain-containing protein [Phthorimaea operculella]